jgi:hypothetical protein
MKSLSPDRTVQITTKSGLAQVATKSRVLSVETWARSQLKSQAMKLDHMWEDMNRCMRYPAGTMVTVQEEKD